MIIISLNVTSSHHVIAVELVLLQQYVSYIIWSVLPGENHRPAVSMLLTDKRYHKMLYRVHLPMIDVKFLIKQQLLFHFQIY